MASNSTLIQLTERRTRDGGLSTRPTTANPLIIMAEKAEAACEMGT